MSEADHSFHKAPEVKHEWSHTSIQTYEFMSCTRTNMPLLHFVLRLSQILGYETLISLEFFIAFLSVMRKNSFLGGFKRLGQNCCRSYIRCKNQTLKYEVSDSSETMLTLRRLMSYIYMEHPFLMFLDHTQRRSTVGRTPLDE